MPGPVDGADGGAGNSLVAGAAAYADVSGADVAPNAFVNKVVQQFYGCGVQPPGWTHYEGFLLGLKPAQREELTHSFSTNLAQVIDDKATLRISPYDRLNFRYDEAAAQTSVPEHQQALLASKTYLDSIAVLLGDEISARYVNKGGNAEVIGSRFLGALLEAGSFMSLARRIEIVRNTVDPAQRGAAMQP